MTTIEDFQLGVTACLRSWSALRTAVESGWGGGERESQTKAENLRQSILELLDGKKHPSSCSEYDIADSLAIYMEEEFSVTLEDNSEQQVAAMIVKMYEGLFQGDGRLCQQILSSADGAIAFNTQFPVQIQTTEHDDEDDENMTDATGDAANASITPPPSAISQANRLDEPLFGAPRQPKPQLAPVRQLGETSSPEPAVEVDDDGFAPVKPKGRKRK
ncbi:unnamed protein product [Cylindrotheca closterium]|uniref:Pre-rRNA-processing protein TSR2 homolog n=1 Tax=Cylindrotheca closterium TaxID=2856 RepID=A0AAD2CGM3_9STRA|nr:unnamed protein product [Cylindrotheca closterium]